MFIYAVRDKNTGKIVKDITNPSHKFWEIKGYCQRAIDNYNEGNHYRRRNLNYDLEMVTYKLVEVKDENK